MPDDRLLVLGIGVVVILAAWVPGSIERRPISLPIVLVALGAAMFALPWFTAVDPRDHPVATRQLTEVGVLVALAGAGISLDRPFGWRRWGSTWRLLGVGMVVSIVGIAALGVLLLRLDLATAVLLGAVLAPTDPVLASDVQVGEPSLDEARLDEEDDVRFTLTSEAGLNDGLAFPFVHLALALAVVTSTGTVGGDRAVVPALAEWAAFDLVYRIAAGLGAGWLIGRLLGSVVFEGRGRFTPIAATSQGFVALGLTMVSYGLAEAVHGYGFLAVFVAAVALRRRRSTAEYHAVLHSFAVEIEQVVSSVLLVLFGGAMVLLLRDATWRDAVGAALVLLVIRPVAGQLALVGSPIRASERRAIAFFGIRGVGSIYYLAFAATATVPVTGHERLWGVVTCTILGSIAIHGVTASGVMRHLDRTRRVRRTRVPIAGMDAGMGARAGRAGRAAGRFRPARSARGSDRRRPDRAPGRPDRPADPSGPATDPGPPAATRPVRR